MFGVPYSPIVPSLTRWMSGLVSAIAYSRLRLPTTLFCWVYTACARSIMEYGAARCSAKCTTASGSKSRMMWYVKIASVRSPTYIPIFLPVSSCHTAMRFCSGSIGTRDSTPSSLS